MKYLIILCALLALPVYAQNVARGPGSSDYIASASYATHPPAIESRRQVETPRIESDIAAQHLRKMVVPNYPIKALEANIRGSVVVAAVIDSHGQITHPHVIGGPEPLQQSAITALSRWTYQPYLVDGRPVPVETTITVQFREVGR